MKLVWAKPMEDVQKTIYDAKEKGEASVMFPLEVGLEALGIMLSGPEDMDLVEGMSAEVTATANRAVTADTVVMLMRDRAMSSASDDDYTADPITIKAGETTGTIMVRGGAFSLGAFASTRKVTAYRCSAGAHRAGSGRPGPRGAGAGPASGRRWAGPPRSPSPGSPSIAAPPPGCRLVQFAPVAHCRRPVVRFGRLRLSPSSPHLCSGTASGRGCPLRPAVRRPLPGRPHPVPAGPGGLPRW